MEEKNKNWNLKKLERQAMENQNFDNFVLNQSKILEYENLKVLDVGCSNGCKTEMLFGQYENIDNITGIDVDENAINEAKSKFVNNKKYSFELKNIEDLDTENKYDIICLSYVLQHLENPKKVLNILKDKLTDRGVLFIKVPDDSFKFCYPDEENLLERIFELYENKIMRMQDITKYTDRYVGKKVYSYLKEIGYSDIELYHNITDTLNLMGAVVSQMNLYNVMILKGISNDVNRKVNCETANLNKTIEAAVKQIKDIELIRDTVGLDSLSDSLMQVALLRLENPDMSLQGLGELLDPPVGKSGVNHRLRKIGEKADELRQSMGISV